VLITVRVHPRASRARSEWRPARAPGVEGGELELWITAPPIEGRANKAVLEAVARELRVPASAVTLRSGARSRVKLVEVDA
jgi:uncharacterized protein